MTFTTGVLQNRCLLYVRTRFLWGVYPSFLSVKTPAGCHFAKLQLLNGYPLVLCARLLWYIHLFSPGVKGPGRCRCAKRQCVSHT